MTEQTAIAVYSLLRLVGAPRRDQDAFVDTFTGSCPPMEWRFQGRLGFGGKFYFTETRWRIGCYVEDDSAERLKIIEAANTVLDALRLGLCQPT